MGGRAVYHLIPEEERYVTRLTARLATCREAVLASAFLTYGAVEALRESLIATLEQGAHISFLVGRFDFVTEPRAVRSLLKLAAKYPTLGIQFDSDYAFHYKLALFQLQKKKVAIVGSSNLTPKGLDSLGEVNLEIVGNNTVYNQAREDLGRRIDSSEAAADVIDEYERGYRRAAKLRRLRRNWEARGTRRWTRKGKQRPTYRGPEGTEFPLCWFDEPETDNVLAHNIQIDYKQDQKRGLIFPNQWVHLDYREWFRDYQEGADCVVIDGLVHAIGFAVCTRKIRVLNREDRWEPVIFYRFRRGWKATFTSEAKFEQVRRRLGFTDRRTIKATLSQKLKAYLISRR